MKGFVKDPDAELDYAFDWSLWLEGDTISSSSWVVDSGITIVPASESFTDTITRLFLMGGVIGQDYVLTNSIITPAGRSDDRSVEIRVRER